MNIHQRFNEKLKDYIDNNKIYIYYSLAYGVAHYFIGSNDLDKRSFFNKASLSISHSSTKELFTKNVVHQDIFQPNIDGRNIKLGFDKNLIKPFVNEIAESDDDEMKSYLLKKLPLISTKFELLYGADTFKAFIYFLKTPHIEYKSSGSKIYQVNSLKPHLFKFIINRLKETDIDFTEELKIFLTPYKNDFKKNEFSVSIINLIQQKIPKKLQEFKNHLNIKDNDKDKKPIESSIDLISVKLDKNNLYKSISNSMIDKDHYWNTLKLVSDFLNKNSKILGLNYSIIDGYSNKDTYFNIIIEHNENFKFNKETIIPLVNNLYSLYFSHKSNHKLNKEDMENGIKLLNFELLNNVLSKNKIPSTQDLKQLKI